MGSERNNGGGTDRPAEEKKGGPFELPEIKFTKLFINGCFVDAVSGIPYYPAYPVTPCASRFLFVPVRSCVDSGLWRVISFPFLQDGDRDLL